MIEGLGLRPSVKETAAMLEMSAYAITKNHRQLWLPGFKR
jgi:hypothetical protein